MRPNQLVVCVTTEAGAHAIAILLIEQLTGYTVIEQAKRLIATGLAGNPPAEIAAELCDVLKLVKQAEKLREIGDKDVPLPQTRKHIA